MNRSVIFATNRAARKSDREALPALVSRAHFGGQPIAVEAISVIPATKDHAGFRVYRATTK